MFHFHLQPTDAAYYNVATPSALHVAFSTAWHRRDRACNPTGMATVSPTNYHIRRQQWGQQQLPPASSSRRMRRVSCADAAPITPPSSSSPTFPTEHRRQRSVDVPHPQLHVYLIHFQEACDIWCWDRYHPMDIYLTPRLVGKYPSV